MSEKHIFQLLIQHVPIILLKMMIGRDRVYFGSYEQDNNYANGKEPILWRVLEVTEDSVLLLSEYGLDSKNINDSFEDVHLETCTMRTWLNETFLKRAFTGEITVMLDNVIHTPDNVEWGTRCGNDTVDKVFLLSVEEGNESKLWISL